VKKRFTCRGVVAAVLPVAIVTAMVCGLMNSYGASQLRHKTSVSGPTTNQETSHGPIVSLHGAAPKVAKSLYAGAPTAARVAMTARALQATKSPAGSPLNDNCAQAISLTINGNRVQGSTVNATYQYQVSDVSYVFVGNGRRVRVSTCFPDTTTAHNFVLIDGGCTSSYLSGSTSLSAPKCTGNIGDTAASFEFDTVDGRSYPIIVYPRSPGVQGQFAIRVSDYANPVNDYCAQAISVKINGAPVQGSTVHATDQTQVDDVIYVFVGNGKRVRISTCFPYTTTAHNFVLLDGGCSSSYLSGSTASSAPNCTNLKEETAASFEFDTVDARSYPILVYPRVPGAWGHFAIQVTAV
jgi:hypothetical protein